VTVDELVQDPFRYLVADPQPFRGLAGGESADFERPEDRERPAGSFGEVAADVREPRTQIKLGYAKLTQPVVLVGQSLRQQFRTAARPCRQERTRCPQCQRQVVAESRDRVGPGAERLGSPGDRAEKLDGLWPGQPSQLDGVRGGHSRELVTARHDDGTPAAAREQRLNL
jgi:hypothetical protein